MKMDRNETIPVYSGRPQKEEDEKKRRVYDALDALSIPYLRAEHNAAHTIEDCAEIENSLGAPVCKNLLLCNRQKTAFYLLIMPGDKPFKTKDVTAQIQSARLSFAGPEDMERLIGCRPGSASLLGLMFDKDHNVSLLIDDELLKDEYWCFHPCCNTATLKLEQKALLEKFLSMCGHAPRIVKLPRYENEEGV